MVKPFISIGTMSGTSADGIDASLIKTDGKNIFSPLFSENISYSDKEKKILLEYPPKNLVKLNKIINNKHLSVIRKIIKKSTFNNKDITVIGFHGQTMAHNPKSGWTWQVADAAFLSKNLGIDVIANFRTRDINYGGQGAPLVPIYHHLKIIQNKIPFPVAIVNIGGISNITFIRKKNDFIGFDLGPGNGPLDKLIKNKLNLELDLGGQLALQGNANKSAADKILELDFFCKSPPKSLDRKEIDDYCLKFVRYLEIKDALATLVDIVSKSIIRGIDLMGVKPSLILISGGGRKNLAIMSKLKKKYGDRCLDIDTLGWDGDNLEAEAFAYIAARSLLGLPITWPLTTGVKKPLSGGVLFRH